MADEEENFYVYRRPRPLWRRKRVSIGELWTPTPIRDLENKDKGWICRTCHRRVHYKDMVVTYELRSGDVYRMWWCCNCDNLLNENNLTDMMIAYELRRLQNEAPATD